jgi:nitrate/TMAO reductase-like tetraheme cytochrome c subunit
MIRNCLVLGLLLAIAGPADSAPAPAGVGRDQTLAALPKANSIAELVARYDSRSCIECHQEAHDQWAESVHSRSIFGTGRTASTFRTAITNGLLEWPASGVETTKDVRVEHLMGCAKCHLPQLADATDKVAQEIVTTIDAWRTAMNDEDEATAEKLAATLGSLNINCLICHNRNAITHKWADGYPRRDTVYGVGAEGEHADGKFTKMAPSPVMSEAILCGQCHGLGPNLELENPTQCATGYGSYLFAYVPEGGTQTCQECHMRASGLGHNMQSYRAKVMSDSAVDMHVETKALVWRDVSTMRPKATVKVELTNRTGHGLPDG